MSFIPSPRIDTVDRYFLTPYGFKKDSDLKKGDLLFSWNKGEYNYQPLLSKEKYFRGLLYTTERGNVFVNYQEKPIFLNTTLKLDGNWPEYNSILDYADYTGKKMLAVPDSILEKTISQVYYDTRWNYWNCGELVMLLYFFSETKYYSLLPYRIYMKFAKYLRMITGKRSFRTIEGHKFVRIRKRIPGSFDVLLTIPIKKIAEMFEFLYRNEVVFIANKSLAATLLHGISHRVKLKKLSGKLNDMQLLQVVDRNEINETISYNGFLSIKKKHYKININGYPVIFPGGIITILQKRKEHFVYFKELSKIREKWRNYA